MDQSVNDSLQCRLRKYESILVISGFGVIAFGLWSIIRAGIYYFLNPLDPGNYLEQSDIDDIIALGKEDDINILPEYIGIVITVFIFVAMSVDLILRLYVGLSARAYGRGRGRRGFYIVIVWIMAFFMLLHIIVVFHGFIYPIIEVIQTQSPDAPEWEPSGADHAASVSLIVDLTSFLVLLELAVSSMKVKKLRKQLGIKPDKKWRKSKKELQELTDEVSQELTRGLSSIMGE